MKKLRFLTLTGLVVATAFLSSCSYDPGTTNNPTAKMNFKKGFHSQYDIFVVDTADKNGSNPDHRLDGTRINVQEIVIDTGITYPSAGIDIKSHVASITTYMPAPTPNETNYLSQDPNGDLYRYNFGFSILNQFPYLVQIVGGNVDEGWVLAAKLTSAVGTKWVAKIDTILISAGFAVNLLSQGEMMADTSFVVGSQTIKTRHARNTVTATALGGAPVGESALVIIDSYYSTDINAVVCDFFRHVSLFGSQYNQQAQGKYKTMTSHD
jgi:hypothetical protein